VFHLRSTFLLALVAGTISAAALSPAAIAADNSAETPYPISSSLPAPVQTFLKVETSPGVFDIDYHYSHATPADNGAYQRNINSPPTNWYIEDQRYGMSDVVGGVLHDDIPLLRTGLKMFDFAFDREASNGSFPGSDGHSLFHGTAYFLAAAGPAMLVLQNWVNEPTLPDGLPAHISWEIGRMKLAATYLVNKWWSSPGHIDDNGKEERKFEAAIALQSVGVLSGDAWLEQKAAVYAQEGDAMTESNGVWTEHGITKLCCHDSSYQGQGLVYGTRYLALLPRGTALYTAVNRTVTLGEQWEVSRVSPSGVLNRTGDDRTGPTCPEQSTTGGCKTADLPAIASALMRWSVLDNDFIYSRRAYYVWLQNWLLGPGNKLPAPGLAVTPATSMSVSDIHNGRSFSVAGTRFQPVEPVTVYFGTQAVGTTTADDIGSFGGHSAVGSVRFTPPATTTPGRYSIKVVGAYGTTRTIQVTITPVSA